MPNRPKNYIGPSLNIVEIKSDGLYINGVKFTAYTDIEINSDCSNLSNITITLLAVVKGLDDQK